MSMVRKVGFFCELPLEEQVKALSSIRRVQAQPDEAKILTYLDAGVTFAAMMGVDEDVLAHPRKPIGPLDLVTDGEWAWPQTLAYYVRNYHIALPEDFVEHMRSSGWECRQNVDVSQLTMEGQVPMG